MDLFNTAMSDLDRLILEAEVFGPDGLADIGRTLQRHGQDLTAVVTEVQANLTSANVTRAQDEVIPAFEAALKRATADVRALLAPA
jgi:hypothetical protein